MPMRSGSQWNNGVMAVLAVASMSAAGLLASGAAPDWTRSPTTNFPLEGGDYFHQRYSALDQINTSTITRLAGAWTLHLEEKPPGGPMDGTPVVIDGIMYVTTGTRSVLAIDAKSGQIKWRYRPGSPGPFGGNKGVVVADGKVVFGRRDNVLVALDQVTGSPVWETKLTTEPAGYTSAPPLYYNGLVYIGTAGGDSGARGQMGAYDIKTGKEVWKLYVIPGPGDRFADTWEADSYKAGGGGIWTGSALDPELGMIYLATGNAGIVQYGMKNYPHDEGARGGDNLLTSSIVALDLKTGAYKWHFQEVHHDIWHYDTGGPSVLADITYRGRPRKVLMNPGKTGYLYILDRTNGKPLIGIEERPVKQEPRLKTAKTQPYPVGDPFVPLCPDPLREYEQGCLFTPYYDKPILIAPGSAGGNAWSPMTFSPKTKLAYVPATILVSVFSRFTKAGEGQFHPPGAERAGTLTALDPTTNKIVWQKKTKYPMGGGSGLLSTAGGLLFHGESDGNLVAYDISNGNELWHFQTGTGVNAPASTFQVDGEQYVAVMAGGNSIALSQRGDMLWAFKLGGAIPEAPPGRQPPLVHPGDAGHEAPAPASRPQPR